MWSSAQSAIIRSHIGKYKRKQVQAPSFILIPLTHSRWAFAWIIQIFHISPERAHRILVHLQSGRTSQSLSEVTPTCTVTAGASGLKWSRISPSWDTRQFWIPVFSYDEVVFCLDLLAQTSFYTISKQNRALTFYWESVSLPNYLTCSPYKLSNLYHYTNPLWTR